jgi:hypothetical protein
MYWRVIGTVEEIMDGAQQPEQRWLKTFASRDRW